MLLAGTSDRFARAVADAGRPPLRRRRPATLQVNLGKLCNQTCRHCHVDAGPTRTEQMTGATAERVLAVLAASPAVTLLDVTGGAPELNACFRPLVEGARALGRQVMVRCNLTVLWQPGQEDLPAFFAARRCHLVASLPCYTQDNVDRQRGRGAFDGSIRALAALNAVGYGQAPLRLDLVYNPLGPSLPPPQAALEADYRKRLREDHGVVFDRLLTLANMPIHRFADDLRRSGKLAAYETLLADAFNPQTLDGLMCRDLVSVDWDGHLADCDFHQMLRLPLGGGRRTIFELDSLDALDDDPIATAGHCFGCTAGQGSSCGGALTG